MRDTVGALTTTDETITTGTAETKTTTLRQYGCDGSGTCHGPSANLGHQLCKLTPKAPNRDYSVTHDSLIVTAEIRFENRVGLLATVAPKADNAVADRQLAATASNQWEQKYTKYLPGAFAVWDTKRIPLFAARGHIGITPLDYYADEGVVLGKRNIVGDPQNLCWREPLRPQVGR